MLANIKHQIKNYFDDLLQIVLDGYPNRKNQVPPRTAFFPDSSMALLSPNKNPFLPQMRRRGWPGEIWFLKPGLSEHGHTHLPKWRGLLI
jgi:hypothetical protein